MNLVDRELGLSWQRPSIRSYYKSLHSPSTNVYPLNAPSYTCKYSNRNNILGFATERGSLMLTKNNQVITINAHENAIMDLCWSNDDAHIALASSDSLISIWDVQTGQRIRELIGHKSTVKTVKFNPSNSDLLCSGSKDNTIMIWDKRFDNHKESGNVLSIPISKIPNAHCSFLIGKKKKVILNMINQKSINPASSVSDVIYQTDDQFIVSCGANDGILKVWDLRNPKHVLKSLDMFPPNARKFGFTNLLTSLDGSSIYVSCMNDCIYEIDYMTFTEKRKIAFDSFQCSSFFIKTDISPCGDYLASGSKDGDVYIWQLNEPKLPPLILKAHTAESTGISFAPYDKLATCSDDMTLRVWDLGHRVDTEHDPRLGIVEEAKFKRTCPDVCENSTPLKSNSRAIFKNSPRLLGNSPSPRNHQSESVALSCSRNNSPVSNISRTSSPLRPSRGQNRAKMRRITDYWGSKE